MLMRNEIISWRNQSYRVLDIYEDQAVLFALQKEDYKGYASAITTQSVEALMHDYDEGALTELPDPYAALRTYQADSKKRERASHNYSLIEPLVTDPNFILDEKNRSKRIVQRAAEIKVNRVIIYRLLFTWWQKGQSVNALTPYVKPGEKKEFKPRNTKNKTGPKSKATENVPPVNDEVRGIFDRVIRDHILDGDNRCSLKNAAAHAVNEYMALHPDRSRETAPTESQLKYHYYQHTLPLERAKGRNTTIKYNKDIRALTGNVYDETRGPGNYESDSTPADIFLVSILDRSKIIGHRPTVYSVIDSYSGMIAGFAISFDPAQYKVAADALYNAIAPKVQYCAKYGVHIEESEWPVRGVPSRFTVDNGELTGEQIDFFARAYGMSVAFTPSYRGDRKGSVERSFKSIMEEKLGEFIEAYPQKITLAKAGGEDTRDKACLNIDDFTTLVIRAVLSYNLHVREQRPRGYPAELSAASLEMWNYGVRTGRAQLTRECDLRNLRLSLLPKYPTSCTEDGFKAEGITWRCPKLMATGLFDRVSGKKRPQGMLMALDPADISTAWLLPDPKTDQFDYWECTLSRISSHLEGMTLFEAKEYLQKASDSDSVARRQAHLYDSIQRAHMARTVEAAKAAQQEATDGAPLSLKGLEENTRVERIATEKASPRMSTAASPRRAAPQSTPSVTAESQSVEYDGHYPTSIDDMSD